MRNSEKNLESRKLTNLLKKAAKMTWWGTEMDKCTFGFAYQNPECINWQMTGQDAMKLYDEIIDMLDTMAFQGSQLTACQRDLLELRRVSWAAPTL